MPVGLQVFIVNSDLVCTAVSITQRARFRAILGTPRVARSRKGGPLITRATQTVFDDCADSVEMKTPVQQLCHYSMPRRCAPWTKFRGLKSLYRTANIPV